jgi:phosphopantetheinyl transferase
VDAAPTKRRNTNDSTGWSGKNADPRRPRAARFTLASRRPRSCIVRGGDVASIVVMNWIDSTAGWDRRLPATLIAIGVSPTARREVPHALAARALQLRPDLVVVEQAEGRPPVLAKPLGAGLYLSSASRGAFSAVAIASSPVGVDVEVVDADGEIPWRVLHAREAALLQPLQGKTRAAAFARLWSIKEAYLKAQGVGLSREPTSFAVRFVDDGTAAVHDPSAPAPAEEIATTWRGAGGAWAAVSTVVLKAPRRR